MSSASTPFRHGSTPDLRTFALNGHFYFLAIAHEVAGLNPPFRSQLARAAATGVLILFALFIVGSVP